MHHIVNNIKKLNTRKTYFYISDLIIKKTISKKEWEKPCFVEYKICENRKNIFETNCLYILNNSIWTKSLDECIAVIRYWIDRAYFFK